MKKIKEYLWSAFALSLLVAFFEDDSHYIISKQGWEVLNEKHNNFK